MKQLIVALALMLSGCAMTNYHSNGDVSTVALLNACSAVLVNGQGHVTCASAKGMGKMVTALSARSAGKVAQ